MAGSDQFNRDASSFGFPGVGTSPAAQRERGFITFSSVSATVSGSTVLLNAPGVGKRHNIWGFSLDASSAVALDIRLKSSSSATLFTAVTSPASAGFIGSKNITLNLPVDCGDNNSVSLVINGSAATMVCTAGVYYMVTNTN